ncbi:MAG: hypothetical protein R3C44_23420 [Chloroflexota bacterium]
MSTHTPRPEENDDHKVSTLKDLLREKPKQGRPPRMVSRQNVYVALYPEQKKRMTELKAYLPEGLARADLPDLAVSVLTAKMEALRQAVAGRNREIPEGVTDMDSLYLLWDLDVPPHDPAEKWTSIRLSPQQVIELGRVHGTLNAVFGANRSETFSLGLALLGQFLEQHPLQGEKLSLGEVRELIFRA